MMLLVSSTNQLEIGADLLQLGEVRAAAEDGLVQRLADVVVIGEIAAAAVRAAVRQDLCLVDIQTVRGGHVPVGIDDQDRASCRMRGR
jgi:hypothetical protein